MIAGIIFDIALLFAILAGIIMISVAVAALYATRDWE